VNTIKKTKNDNKKKWKTNKTTKKAT